MIKIWLLPVVLLSTLVSVHAQDVDNYINKKSPYTVVKTLDRLENILKSKGITVFARVDHAAGGKAVSIAMRPAQLLIFGNPKMGTPLMNENTMMGLDLPMKALAWEDEAGQVWLSYIKPSVLQQRHGLKNTTIIEKMTAALDALTGKAIAVN